MKQIPVSQFKANCSSLVEQVRKTKRSIQITRRGKGHRGNQAYTFRKTQ